MIRLFLVAFVFTAFISGGPLWALDFSGNTDDDFSIEACQADPAGQNLGMPPSFPADSVSGFDIDEICLIYDETDDTLYIGIRTFEDADGDPIPFGDADGDGDPSSTGAALAAEGGEDFANLADEEYFSFIFDLDDDDSTAPEVIAGVSAERSATSGFRVSEIALPHLGASTNEAESNCAVMVADSLRNYLESGIIRNSVNFPDADIAHTDSFRLTIANENVPNMVGQISTMLGDAGLNIEDLLNKSRGDLAYTIVDLDAEVPDEIVASLQGIEGVLCVRNLGRQHKVA